jgi:hypothetical protein
LTPRKIRAGWLVIVPRERYAAILAEFAARGFDPADHRVIVPVHCPRCRAVEREPTLPCPHVRRFIRLVSPPQETFLICVYRWDAMVAEHVAAAKPFP